MRKQGGSARFFARWVVTTFGGWLLGCVAIILLAGIEERLHSESPIAIGLGMAMGVGFAQWRAAAEWFEAPGTWFWASILGMAAPFLLSDAFSIWTEARMEWLIGVNVVAGALLAGLWQQRILQSRSSAARWWVPASGVGWLLAAVLPLTMMLGRHPSSSLELWRNLGALASGGVALGVVTGGALALLLAERRRTTAYDAATNQ